MSVMKLKCEACKYEDDRFAKIDGHFTYEEFVPYYPNRIHEIDLYACPECGTVKIVVPEHIKTI